MFLLQVGQGLNAFKVKWYTCLAPGITGSLQFISESNALVEQVIRNLGLYQFNWSAECC